MGKEISEGDSCNHVKEGPAKRFARSCLFIAASDCENEVKDYDCAEYADRGEPFCGRYQRRCPLSLNERSARRPSEGQIEIEEIEHGVASIWKTASLGPPTAIFAAVLTTPL